MDALRVAAVLRERRTAIVQCIIGVAGRQVGRSAEVQKCAAQARAGAALDLSQGLRAGGHALIMGPCIESQRALLSGQGLGWKLGLL